MTWDEMRPGAVVRYEFGLLRVDHIGARGLSYSTHVCASPAPATAAASAAWVQCGSMRRRYVERAFLRSRLWNLLSDPPTPEQSAFADARKAEAARRRAGDA